MAKMTGALSEGTRRIAMRLSWGALLIAASLLVGLRIGRPAYYTDGARELPAAELSAAGMLQWRTPMPLAELPGPVTGRIALLVDGRVLYARLGADGTSDLVTWDPARPTVPPEPVHALNTEGDELSPAIDAEGRVWFASDREGGSGGHDLYVAPRLLAAAAEVERVAECSSPLDECDPAPSPDGSEVVFVRSSREPGVGDHGTLWRCALDGASQPRRVFDVDLSKATSPRPVDRDPSFAKDGAALWFVRAIAGRLTIVRSSRLEGTFAEPLAIDGDWSTPPLCSPVPSSDGRTLYLCAPPTGDVQASLWYAANAHEVYPWWPGQRWLELVLLGVVIGSLLFLVLLHYGRRFTALDLVAQCLLLSLLLHVLLYLLLKGVEIAQELPLSDEDGTGFEVTLVSATEAAGTADAGAGSGIAAEVRFAPTERSLGADAPMAALVRADSDALDATNGEWTRELEATATAPVAQLVDAPVQMAVRAGSDAVLALESATVATAERAQLAAAAATTASRPSAASASLAIATPGSGLVRAERGPVDPALVEGSLPSPSVAAKAVPIVTGPALRDAASLPSLSAPAAVADAPTAAPLPVHAGAPVVVATPSASVVARAADRGPVLHRPSAAPAPSSALVRAKPSALANAAALPATPSTAMPPSLHAAPVPDLARRDAPIATPRTAAPTASANAAAAAPSPRLAAIAMDGPRELPIARPLRDAADSPRGEQGIKVVPPPSQLVRSQPVETAMPAALPVAKATAYSNRFGPAKAKALEQFGGTDETEHAVRQGLRYLASIQNVDGSWGSGERFDDKYGLVYVGKTALCVLAFLGAGHSPKSNTEHSDVVRRAVDHLLELQDEETGAFGVSSCYGHGISSYALAECYGMTKDEALLPPLERALTWILDHQGPRRDKRNRGGWGYFSPGLRAEDDFARVSVSAWMIMALESARLSGVELPEDVLPKAKEYLELSYDQPNGWFRYSHEPSRVRSSWPTLPASTPAAAFCLQLLGVARDDSKVDAAVSFTVERRPQEYRRYDDEQFVKRGQGNVYFWYYGTLCCFLRGGDEWASWNERLRTVLPAAQAKDGSFPPIDVYAQEAGDTRKDRSYTTAMCVLSLEIYYRYFTPLLTGR